MNNSNQKQNRKGQSQAQRCMRLIQNLNVITDSMNVYVCIPSQGKRTQLLQVPSTDYDNWLTTMYFDQYNEFLSKPARQLIEAKITTQAKQIKHATQVNRRFGHTGSALYIDMGKPGSDDSIEIANGKWSITPASNLTFLKNAQLLELPNPIKGGDPRLLFKYLNVTNRKNQVLILAWLCSLPLDIEHPILLLKGSQASGKTTAAERIRSIFDPASPLTMSVPSSTLNLVLNFSQNPVCLFDNMGSIPSQTADDFCKAVTGAGFAIRALYTNSHLIHYNYKRPIIITSINLPSQKSDFISRCLTIPMKPIHSDQRISKSDIDRGFKQDLPEILGGILDLLVEAKSNMQHFAVKQKTRMGDFDELGCGVAMALRINPNKFMEWRFELEQDSLFTQENKMIYQVLANLIEDNGGALKMNATDLSNDLSNRLSDLDEEPVSPGSLGKKLKSMKDQLSQAYIDIKKAKVKGCMEYEISLGQPQTGHVEMKQLCAHCVHYGDTLDTIGKCLHFDKGGLPTGYVNCPHYEFKAEDWDSEYLDTTEETEADNPIDITQFFGMEVPAPPTESILPEPKSYSGGYQSVFED